MKKEEFFEVMGEIDEAYLKEMVNTSTVKIKKKTNWKIWAATAACLAVFLVLSIAMFKKQHVQITLSDASKGVAVKYINKAPAMSSMYDLVFLTEEELFFEHDTTILKGTITKLDNIEMDFNGNKEYRAIANIKVEKVYRGNCQESESISVLLPCPINAGVWVEDTETVATMRVGRTGIFMIMKYDSNSFMEQNGARLALKDIGDYGFLDGSRYAFIETENNLIFARWAYESIAYAKNLQQIEEYILNMVAKNK